MATLSAPYVFHEDAFYEYFKPIRHSGAKHNIWGGLGLETFGEDFDSFAVTTHFLCGLSRMVTRETNGSPPASIT